MMRFKLGTITMFKYSRIDSSKVKDLITNRIVSSSGRVEKIMRVFYSDHSSYPEESYITSWNSEMIFDHKFDSYEVLYENGDLFDVALFELQLGKPTLSIFGKVNIFEHTLTSIQNHLKLISNIIEPEILTLDFNEQRNSQGYHLLVDLYGEELVDSENYFYAFYDSPICLYPPKDIRDKVRLPLPDEVFLNIPAEKVEVTSNGYIQVFITTDLSEPIEKYVEKEIKAIQYYKQVLESMGLWGVVKWDGKNWRDTYRQVLKEKGFEV